MTNCAARAANRFHKPITGWVAAEKWNDNLGVAPADVVRVAGDVVADV